MDRELFLKYLYTKKLLFTNNCYHRSLLKKSNYYDNYYGVRFDVQFYEGLYKTLIYVEKAVKI